MAGHSKWANIKHRKAAQDAKRGKIFTKLIREITVAARLGGADTSSNPRLRDAISNALSQNMTRDTVNRAVTRGAGGEDGADMENITYEGYGPSGVAILVECLTDNRNRTVADVRHAFTRAGGSLGTDGSVAYLFTKLGQVTLEGEHDEDTILEAALEAGAEDVEHIDDTITNVLTSWEEMHKVAESLKEQDFTVKTIEAVQQAETLITLDKEAAEKLIKLVDHLEDLDDVQHVHTNADIPEDVLEQLDE